MRKLCLFGCTGSYSEREEMLAFFYDGFKIGSRTRPDIFKEQLTIS